jgi:hypothetical protein
MGMLSLIPNDQTYKKEADTRSNFSDAEWKLSTYPRQWHRCHHFRPTKTRERRVIVNGNRSGLHGASLIRLAARSGGQVRSSLVLSLSNVHLTFPTSR